MDTDKAIEIVNLLANGVDPETGEVFPNNSPYQHPEVIRSLFLAIKALEKMDKSEKRQKRLPRNAGKSWTEEEEYLLVKAFDEGKSINELSEVHKRTKGSIRSRLIKLEKIEEFKI
ncbi:hypothetical protein [Tenuibacillus multivorans]|uniref:Homeodomain-like domain-containing protein n=1 Tax=Tenuibacillus multivorans TaxID=237069 RepID=A0A1H0EB18_9BACI|nr:hypothetical protein [Tenuibacillus multivorans]GEL78739.1 hypothetical protein TMU01_29740 [Tenuibacillus multivorans]SDN79592.1 hypothetical protein SAMN05216498_3083 [Tenuibacillus multivorans]